MKIPPTLTLLRVVEIVVHGGRPEGGGDDLVVGITSTVAVMIIHFSGTEKDLIVRSRILDEKDTGTEEVPSCQVDEDKPRSVGVINYSEINRKMWTLLSFCECGHRLLRCVTLFCVLCAVA